MTTIFFHEMKQGVRMLLIWGIVVALLVATCMLIFPSIESQSAGMDEMFAAMGGFTAAFGMDKLSLSDPLGYYGVQGGPILGLGGAMFAALLGVRMLSKEEGEHTAEFLLTHPVSRISVIGAKLCALIAQILLFNLICLACGVASFEIIGEPITGEGFWLFHLAQCMMHLEIACVCFGISALLERGGMGFGLALAALLYFLNIFTNISKDWDFMRYITPFGYADAVNVLPQNAINSEALLCGVAYLVIGVVVAFVVYSRKDIVA